MFLQNELNTGVSYTQVLYHGPEYVDDWFGKTARKSVSVNKWADVEFLSKSHQVLAFGKLTQF